MSDSHAEKALSYQAKQAGHRGNEVIDMVGKETRHTDTDKRSMCRAYLKICEADLFAARYTRDDHPPAMGRGLKNRTAKYLPIPSIMTSAPRPAVRLFTSATQPPWYSSEPPLRGPESPAAFRPSMSFRSLSRHEPQQSERQAHRLLRLPSERQRSLPFGRRHNPLHKIGR